MTGLRTKWGVNLFKIESDFGMDFKNYFENGVLKYLENKQLLRISSNEIIVNPEFYFSIDGIVADLFWVG
jgi:oxygen-independent coproporphyrinogen-3 oxidase